jgi:hypothetical protein
MSDTPAEGFYPDPQVPGQLRRWDGVAWTDEVRTAGQEPTLGAGYATLAAYLQGLLGLYCGLAVLAAAYLIWQRNVLNDWVADPTLVDQTVAERMDTVSLVIGLAPVLVFLVTGVLFVVWLYRGIKSSNIDQSRMQHKAWWAIGGWFIPIWNLFRPFQMVRDFWLAANVKKQTGDLDTPRLIGWWWALNLLAILTERVYALGTRDLAQLDGLAWMQATSDAAFAGATSSLLLAAAAVLAALMVAKITAVVLR